MSPAHRNQAASVLPDHPLAKSDQGSEQRVPNSQQGCRGCSDYRDVDKKQQQRDGQDPRARHRQREHSAQQA